FECVLCALRRSAAGNEQHDRDGRHDSGACVHRCTPLVHCRRSHAKALVLRGQTHMPTGPAARLGDTTAHGGALVPGPGSPTVFIGGKPAWRGLGAAGVAAITAAASAALSTIMQAKVAADAAAGTPAGPAAQANFAKT